MQISRVKSGDIVKCDIKGRIFFATVTEKKDGESALSIQPMDPRFTHYSVTARQVVSHWRKSK